MADFTVRGDTSLDGSGMQQGLSAMTVAAGNLIAGLVAKVASGVQQAIGAGVNFNAQMQTYTSNFSTMLGGNAAAAQTLIDKIHTLAAKTPLEMSTLASAAQTLLNFGAADATTMTDTLKMLGDVSLGNAAKMQAMSLAYGQMTSTGKLQGQDLLQMINAGFNPLQELSTMGYGTVAELKDKMSKGAISVEMVQAAFQHATSEGGKFYNAMENASTTFEGRLSTLKDDATSFAGLLTESLTNGLSTNVLPAADAIVQQLSDGFSSGGITGMVQAAGNLVSGFVDSVIANAPQAITAGAQTIAGFLDGLAGGDSIPTMLAKGAELVGALAGAVLTSLPSLISSATEVGITFIDSIASGLAEGIPTFLANALPMITDFTANLRENAGQLVDAGLNLITQLATGLISSLPVLIEQLPQIVINIAGIINDNAPKVLECGLKLIVQLAAGLVQAIPTLLANLPQIIEAIVAVFTAFNWLNLGKNIIEFFTNGIKSMVGAVKGAGDGIFAAIKDTLINLPKTLKNLGSNATDMMAGGIKSMLSAVMGAAKSILSGILSSLSSLPTKLMDLAVKAVAKLWVAFSSGDWGSIGSNIINGIISGIGSAVGGLVDAAIGAAESAFAGAKKALGIHSPSRKFRNEIGRQIPAGEALGIQDNAHLAVSAARTTAEDMVAAAQGVVMETNFHIGSGILSTGTTAAATLNASWRGESNTVIQMDGREVARATAPYMDEQLAF